MIAGCLTHVAELGVHALVADGHVVEHAELPQLVVHAAHLAAGALGLNVLKAKLTQLKVVTCLVIRVL
jgi:hypothetical protein